MCVYCDIAIACVIDSLVMLDVLCVVIVLYFFFFKQKTAYEMRISDWSSDVCSSDLGARDRAPDPELLHLLDQARFGVARWRLRLVALDLDTGLGGREIGRASCRERVCPYV